MVYGSSGKKVDSDDLFNKGTFARTLTSDCNYLGEFDVGFEFDIPEFVDQRDDGSHFACD